MAGVDCARRASRLMRVSFCMGTMGRAYQNRAARYGDGEMYMS
jgi:hypothetical protein